MSKTDLVRPSRDGDQFHYLRAARLCLELLSPNTDLAVVSIEGVPQGEEIEAGLDVIDLGLYYGSADIAQATQVHYRQFKHSTLQSELAWTASGLKKSLVGFAARYPKLVERFGREDVSNRFVFEFETNRPISADVIGAIADLAAGVTSKRSDYLRRTIGLTGQDLQRFCKLVRLLPNASDYLTQRQLLEQDMGAYLPDSDKDAPLKLKELVTRKATSEYAKNPAIRREDVLQSIDADMRDLFPAPLLIELPDPIVEREQMASLMSAIISSPGLTILEADGGVGKSVVATRMGSWLPEGSPAFVYDCFGNGGYRSPSEYRHRPRDGFAQLANEMAAEMLCDPLIPTFKSDASAFMRAFKARVTQASAALAAENADRLLLIVIDAADNAQMAADEAQDGPSFPRLLLRESYPPNVRIVLTARPHRVELLNPPPEVARIELLPFTEAETAAHLRGRFPSASIQDVQEFHRLTSHNPRVQKVAFEAGETLPEVLGALGPTPRSVEDTIGALLEAAIAKVRDAAANVEQAQLDSLCEALATLRPFVPLAVVAATAKVSVELVRSIAHDLGRPLLIREDAVQFRDEPTETWFRDRFRPTSESLSAFVSRLKPFASTSAYVAAVLPQLMLEAGEFEALVTLALTGAGLPADGAIARRDIELQRLQFALKAALRSKRYVDAAKLALKAGGETAADNRQQALLSENTDLAARFLDANQIVDQVSRRLISGGGWTGSEHSYEAALLSGNDALGGDARSRLRLAYDWLNHWIRRKRSDDSFSEQVEDTDIAELQLAELNLHGPEACVEQLSRWCPRDVSLRVGKILIGRLVDAGRFDDIDALALAASTDVGLLLAILIQLNQVGRFPPKGTVKRALELAGTVAVEIRAPADWHDEDYRIEAIHALVVASLRWRLGSKRDLARLLKRYLPKNPPRSLYSQFSLDERASHLRGYALRAALLRASLTLEKLAHPELRKTLNARHDTNSDTRRFRENVGALLPWHLLSAEVHLGRVSEPDLPAKIAEAKEVSRKAEDSYRERSETADEIAVLWAEIILTADKPELLWPDFNGWLEKLKQPLFIPTLVTLSRRAARANGQEARALEFAAQAFRLIEKEKENAESKAETYVSIARAVLPASPAEAQQFFEEAIVVSSRIGEENLSRWHALLHLATVKAGENVDEPELAYRFARAAELTYAYVVRDKHFDWEDSVKALTNLSARSAPAIVSRWEDRGFGNGGRIFPRVIWQLVASGDLDARDALPLIGIHGRWKYPRLLKAALVAATDALEKNEIANFAFGYLRYTTHSSKDVKELQAIFEEHSIEGISLTTLLQQAEALEAKEERETRSYSGLRDKPIDWEAIFREVNVTESSGLATALELYRATGRGYYREAFFEQAISLVPAGQERSFLEAVGEAVEPDLYELRGLLEALPAEWLNRLSVRPALAKLARETYRRSAGSVSADRHYQLLPLTLVTNATGLASEDLYREAVDAIGSTALPVGANDLFQLAGVLAQLIPVGGRLDTLTYGLELLEPALDPNDGDGPWDARLMPPKTCEEAIAGNLWAALGAIGVSRRWQAAHAARGFFRLGRRAILDALIGYADKRVAGPFADAALRFYDQHAVQWLLIALARSALESGQMVARHVDFLRKYATLENLHVVTRAFAAQALLSLHAQGFVTLPKAEEEGLRSINSSRLQPIASRSYERPDKLPADRPYADKNFHFGYDFDKYWVAPLARCFSLTDDAVEIELEKVIRDDWGLDDNGRWDDDERAVRRFFRDDRGRSQGSFSKKDDLSFYLSYHALMTVAGKLLDRVPLHEDPEDDWSSFRRWVAEQGLTRSDGMWLADRRDPTPLDCDDLVGARADDWSVLVDEEAVVSTLQPTPSAIVVAGWWTKYAGARLRQTSVASALVTPGRIQALGRALSSAADRHDYRVPDFGDHLEIEHNEFVLKGWITERGAEARIDEKDPWSGAISTKLFTPSSDIESLLSLDAGSSQRSWMNAGGDRVLWSEVWSNGDGDEDERQGRGKRLVASRAFLDTLLAATDKALLFEVNINQRRAYDKYDRDGDSNASEITGIFTIEEQSEPSLIRPNPRPGRKARRRTEPW